MRIAGLLFTLASLSGQLSLASTVVYTSQSLWQSAMGVDGMNVASVSFASADWSSSFQSSRSFNSLTSESSTAASDGMTISAVSGYSPLGVANNSLLGQAAGGVWSDTISKYGSTTFNFSTPIYGFGGDFNIAGSNGLEILAGGNAPVMTPAGMYDGFLGLVSSQPISSITITWGQDAGCNQVFGNSYVLSDFQLATDAVPTPEPNFGYALAGALVLVVSLKVLKK